ncbi:MAG: flagellar assembly protein FliW [Spirochaetales bacterium]|nr:flagellar assembly protein FliW [Spirochaetales bacterium]
MIVKTKPFGDIEVDERQRLHFPQGILGFENLNSFVLLDATQPPFYWLQSLDEPEIAFVLMNPVFFKPDYAPDVSPDDLEDIGITGPDDQLVFAIVTIPKEQQLMTANLQGPIIVNKRSKMGRQAISHNPRWLVKHYILEELAAVKDRAC